MSTATLEQLQRATIEWKPSAQPYVFEADFNGQKVLLRLNDFPEEPLCTIILDGAETNLDDLAKGWTLPKHRGE